MRIPEEIATLLRKLYGANTIVTNEKDEILVFRSKYGKELFMLPGGKAERNELPQHAALSETEEETDLYITTESLKMVGVFMQRVKGLSDIKGYNFLFHSDKYTGELTGSDESHKPQWMSVDEIIERQKEFGTSYLRMILHYLNWKEDNRQINAAKRMSDPVSVFYKGKMITV
jgi:ADP-ribose pyrophosphatase YjhB (NUDIX family)